MRSSPWATGLQARLPHGRGPPANVKLTAHIEVAAITSIRRRMTGQVKVAEASPDRQGASARKAHALAVLHGAPGGTRTPDPQIRSLGARVPPSPITSQRAPWHWSLPVSPSLRVPLNPTRSQGPWPQLGHKIPPELGGQRPEVETVWSRAPSGLDGGVRGVGVERRQALTHP